MLSWVWPKGIPFIINWMFRIVARGTMWWIGAIFSDFVDFKLFNGVIILNAVAPLLIIDYKTLPPAIKRTILSSTRRYVYQKRLKYYWLTRTKSSAMLYISVLKLNMRSWLYLLSCSWDNNTILHERTRELTWKEIFNDVYAETVNFSTSWYPWCMTDALISTSILEKLKRYQFDRTTSKSLKITWSMIGE